MSKRITILLLLLVILLGAFFRFYEITKIPLGLYPDEAMNGNNALEALATGNFKMFYPENNGREGLFINIQAVSLWLFGNEPWALRVVSAVIGTLTILGVYLLTKELFSQEASSKKQEASTTVLDSKLLILDSRAIALLSSFFLATSYWHINFSRIGFRAIMIPFLAAFGTYFLLKGLRTGKIWPMIWAGIFIGLGFHTYIAFRFMPFVFAVPIIWYLVRWWRNRQITALSCAPCLIALFLFVIFMAALPIGLYFMQNPQDFFGRTGQVSIFSADSPLLEFAKSNLATLGMFFARGDCNWRHNFNCQPQLYPLVGFFFLIGVISGLRGLFRNQESGIRNYGTLFAWLFFLSLPATLTREGLPHALRVIGLIPPIMIFAGIGAWKVLEFVFLRLEKQKQNPALARKGGASWPQYAGQLFRIRREISVLFILILFLVPVSTYRNYFVRWANNPETYFAFSTDLWHLGQYLDGLPPEIKKYVVVNLPGVEVRGLPMPAQTVMFATDTFREEKKQEKNFAYILPNDLEKINADDGKTIIAPLKGDDMDLLQALRERFPGAKIQAPSDFVIFEP